MTPFEYWNLADFIESHIAKNKPSIQGRWKLRKVKIALRNKIPFIAMNKIEREKVYIK